MAIIQEIVNGQIPEADTTSTTSKTKESDSTKDMFLKLLVTEMKYQDPLQPTDNSEYVKEMATFTQVETMQALQSDVSNMDAKSLVGKYVTVANDSGEAQGIVDFVTEQDGEMKISVNDELYSIDDITSVQNETYYYGQLSASTFATIVSSLPPIASLSYSDLDKVSAAETMLNSMSAYDRSFVSEDVMKTYNSIVERMNDLIKAHDAIAAENEAATDSKTAEETAGTASAAEEADSTDDTSDAAESDTDDSDVTTE